MSSVTIESFVQEYLGRLRRVVDELPLERVEAVGELLFTAYTEGKQVFVVGNGGSAATASHLTCDLAKATIGTNLPRLRITSLGDNVPLLTALANDAGYDHVFSEQLVGLLGEGDVLVVLSGSGRSPNVLEAMRFARSRSATVVALLGFDGGAAAELADEHVVVPVDDYGLVEDVHMILGHVLTGYFRERLRETGGRPPTPAG